MFYNEILILGLYHYAITCNDVANSVILRRAMILQCFVNPYNPTFLKAFDGKMNIVPVFSTNEWFRFEEKMNQQKPTFENGEINELLSSHNVASLPEFFSLSDEKKIRDIASTKTEYIATYSSHKNTFRKVPMPRDDTYFVKGRGHFEMLSNNILRHYGRRNGNHLLLIETCLYYDVMTKKDSEDIFAIYKDKVDKIPDGDVVSINNSKLPVYILCETQILKLRKSRKVLKIPYFVPETLEYKFSKVLLYYPMEPKMSIEMERLGMY